MIQKRYIVWNGMVVTLTNTPPSLFWFDPNGTLVALENPYSADPIARCGIGALSLSTDHPLTSACKVHDYAYNSPAYQAFHTREEADEELYRLMKILGQGHWYGVLARPFFWLSRIFGRRYWEGPPKEPYEPPLQ